MTYQHYRSPFGDTTFTKVFVGGLAWETPTDEMHNYFQQFGEILEAVIITDKNTAKSKGYGFVTFRDPESARRACAEPNPIIDGRRANCNVASLGRPRPSPPRGRFQGGNPSYTGGGTPHGQGAPSSYGGVSGILPPPPPPLPQQVIYPPYGYQPYTPDIGYHQAVYNTQQQQYYNQMYGTTSNSNMSGSPYYYHGYSMQPSRGAYPAPHAQRIQGPSYVYYPTQHMAEGSFSSYPTPPQLQPLQLPTTGRQQQHFSSSSDTVPAQRTSTEPEPPQITSSESPNT